MPAPTMQTSARTVRASLAFMFGRTPSASQIETLCPLVTIGSLVFGRGAADRIFLRGVLLAPLFFVRDAAARVFLTGFFFMSMTYPQRSIFFFLSWWS